MDKVIVTYWYSSGKENYKQFIGYKDVDDDLSHSLYYFHKIKHM